MHGFASHHAITPFFQKNNLNRPPPPPKIKILDMLLGIGKPIVINESKLI